MKGICLQFYMGESYKHQGKLAYEWLLEAAKSSGIEGGSVFKMIADYGRQGIHEERLFELGSQTSVKVEFFLSEEQAQQLLEVVKQEALDLFYSRSSAEFGYILQ